MTTSIATLLAVLAQVPARGGAPAADSTLDRLRATLSGLQATEPVKGTVQLSEWKRETKDKKPREFSGTATVHFDVGKESIGLRVSGASLARARAEANAGRDAPRPTRNVLGQIDPLAVEGWLDAGKGLLEQLRDAELLEDRPDASRGRPGRVLRLKLGTRGGDAPSQVKVDADATLRVWVDAEGLPLASDQTSRFEAGILFLKGKGTGRTTRTYQKIGMRLVAVEETDERSFEGLGSEGASKRVLRIAITSPQPTAPAP